MIEYDKRRWTSHLFDLEGSMIREITGRVGATIVWAVAVVILHHTVKELQISPTVHTLVGAALGLLLVFRTNASYDRYWDGRRQWGAIINESRNLARGLRNHLLGRAPDLAESAGLWTSAFAHAAMNSLRERQGLGPLADRLPRGVVRSVLDAPHPPSFAAARISRALVEARDRGVISDIVLVHLDQNVQQFLDCLGACERIRKTPLPFVYVVHLRRALILYCFTLPLALVQFYGWWTILVTLLASYTFFGIEEIGVEIENPFGVDANDLPLERFCWTIDRDVMGLLEAELPDAPLPSAEPVVDPGDGPAAALAV